MSTINCSDYVPYSWEYFQGLPTAGIVMVGICGLLTAFTVILYLLEVMYMWKNVSDLSRRQKTILLLGLYPVFSFTSLMGMCIPRASTLTTLVSTSYLSVCIYSFLHLMINYYGNEETMIKRLAEYQIPLRSPPCCCCLCCLPKIKLTEKNLSIIKRMIYQIVIVSPLESFLAAVFWVDGLYSRDLLDRSSAYPYLTVIKIVSTLTAMYGLLLLFRVSRLPLKSYSIQPKFILLQIVLVLANLQTTITSTLASAGVVPCTTLMPSNSRAEMLDHILIIGEMFILSLIARFMYRKKFLSEDEEVEEEEDDEVARDHIPKRMSTAGLVKTQESGGYGTNDITFVSNGDGSYI